MFRGILIALGLGFGSYLIYRAMNPGGISTVDGEGGGLVDDVTSDFLGAAYYTVGSFGDDMQISFQGLAHIKLYEGFRAARYLDQAGKPTIGYGHLLKPWETMDVVTQAEADALLLDDLATAEAAVNRLVSVPLTQSQFDALVSFVFNVGVGAFTNSTLRKLVNAGNYASASSQFTRWVYITQGGKKVVSNGLMNRRLADQKLFNGGVTA